MRQLVVTFAVAAFVVSIAIWWALLPSFGDNCAPGDWHWIQHANGTWHCEEGDF
jgi:hypothetical protein